MSTLGIELCLCGRCAGIFYHSPGHRIKRTDPLQIVREECMCCRSHTGYDYAIWEINKTHRRLYKSPGYFG